MSVPQIMAQHVQKARFDAGGIVGGPVHPHTDAVRPVEADIQPARTEQIGISANLVHGGGSPAFIATQGFGRGQTVVREGQHDLPQPELAGKSLTDGFCLGGGDPLDLRETARFLFQDPQGLVPEFFDDPRGGGDADPLNRAGGQIAQDRIRTRGQMLFRLLGAELPPEARVLHPFSFQAELFPRRDRGQHADHFMQFLTRFELQHRPAVVRVAENHPFHTAAELFEPIVLHRVFLSRPGRPENRPGSNIYSSL